MPCAGNRTHGLKGGWGNGPARAEHIADAAVTWLRTQYPDLTATDSAELHDRRLARVVRNYQAGNIPAASVVDAVREWRTHIGDWGLTLKACWRRATPCRLRVLSWS
jgi:hypothetical protein